MARRANDPDLLRAQAQGGRDGENVWRTAKRQLTGQRQSAVQQAMQAAALRGTPGAAVAQLGNRVARPYNAAIRDTTQMAGVYGADMAAREGRMDDYGQAILAARQLIPLQIQQTVAPIRAENRYNLQALRQEGQNRIGEINAQTALQLAQLQADIRRQQLEDAANGPTLTEGELQAALTEDSLSRVNKYSEAIGGAVEEGQQQARTEFRGELGTARTEAQGAALKQASAGLFGTPGANLFEARAAMLGQTPGYVSTAGADPFEQRAAEFAVNPPPNVAGTNALGFPPPAGVDPLISNAGVDFVPQASIIANQGAQNFDVNAFQSAIQGQAPDTDEMNQYRTESEQAATDLAKLRARGPQPLSRFGNISSGQLASLTPYERSLVMSAADQGTPIMNPGDVQEILFGRPSAINKVTGQATINPLATDVRYEAMQAAAAQLSQQGYDINMPEIQNAILNTGSLFDINQAQQGLPTTADLVDAAQAIGGRKQADKKQEDTENRAKLRTTFYQRYGVPMPGEDSDVENIAGVALSPETGPVFEEVFKWFMDIMAKNNYDITDDDAINQAFQQANVGGNVDASVLFSIRQLLKDMRS